VNSRYLKNQREVKESLYSAHNQALVELAEKNPKIVSCYADFPPGDAGKVFAERFPDRFIDVGIAEGHLISAAAGLAEAGFIPFTHCHTLFGLGRGYNQIRQNVVYDSRNVKIVLCNSGVIWEGIGPSHLSIEDIAALRAIPNLVIVSPADAVETAKATFAAAEYEGPVVMRLPAAGDSFATLYTQELEFTIGKGIIVREGSDVSIVATGILVAEALPAAEKLEEDCISARLIDMHTLKPLDTEIILAAAAETGAIVTVEDATVIGGLGGAVAELVCERNPVPVMRVGIKDQFGDSGSCCELQACYGLTSGSILEAVHAALALKSKIA
jgi:transketolase